MRKPIKLTEAQKRQARIDFARSGGIARQAGMTDAERSKLGSRAVQIREAKKKESAQVSDPKGAQSS